MTHTLYTLFRPPTPELQILCWSGQLKPMRLNEYSALRFLTNALTNLRIAQDPACVPIDQLNTSFSSIYSLCLGSLYLHGLLPNGEAGSQGIAIHLGSEMLNLTQLERDKILNAHAYLHLMQGDFPEEVELEVSKDMLRLGQHAVRQAHKVFPDWFD